MGDEQRPRFSDFPRGYPDHYFKMLTNEEKHQDGSFHAGRRPTEALDCRVYALCASDTWIDSQITSLREQAQKKGMPRRQAEGFYTTRSVVLAYRTSRDEERKQKK